MTPPDVKNSFIHATAVTVAYFLCRKFRNVGAREWTIAAQQARRRHTEEVESEVPAVQGAACVQDGSDARPNPARIFSLACLPSL